MQRTKTFTSKEMGKAYRNLPGMLHGNYTSAALSKGSRSDYCDCEKGREERIIKEHISYYEKAEKLSRYSIMDGCIRR